MASEDQEFSGYSFYESSKKSCIAKLSLIHCSNSQRRNPVKTSNENLRGSLHSNPSPSPPSPSITLADVFLPLKILKLDFSEKPK